MIAASLPDKKSARKPASANKSRGKDAAKKKAKPQPRAAKREREKPKIVRKVETEPKWESVPYRLTVEQYHALAGTSVFAATDRVELIHGIVYTMPPIGSEHAAHTKTAAQVFYKKAPKTVLIGLGDPITLPPDSEPQPDLSVVRWREDAYREGHPQPQDVLLVVEVSDSSAAYDIGLKARLYAQAGIPEYWVLDLPAQRVRVFREPAADGYAVEEALARGKTVRCSTVPELVFEVGELLL